MVSMTTVTVHQMHEGTGEEQQIGRESQSVAPVLSKQVERYDQCEHDTGNEERL